MFNHRDKAKRAAFSFAQTQAERFSTRSFITYTELSIIVDAIYAMAGVSGSVMFAYALRNQNLSLFVTHEAKLKIAPVASGRHSLPESARDLPFFSTNRITENTWFAPLFGLGPKYSSVLCKNTIWLRDADEATFIPFLLHSEIVAAKIPSLSYLTMYCFPVVYDDNGTLKLGLMQVKAAEFREIRDAVYSNGDKTFAALTKEAKSGDTVASTKFILRASEEPSFVHLNFVETFWQEYVDYAEAVASINAETPAYILDALLHSLINTQKPLCVLKTQLFS